MREPVGGLACTPMEEMFAKKAKEREGRFVFFWYNFFKKQPGKRLRDFL